MTKVKDIYVDNDGVVRNDEGREVTGFMMEAKAVELMTPLVRDGLSDRKIADTIGITQHVVEMMRRKHAARFYQA